MKNARFAIFILSALVIAGAAASRASAAPSPVHAFAGLAFQPAQPDPFATSTTALAFASLAGPSRVESLTFVPVSALDCNDVDYRTAYILDLDVQGVPAPALYSISTLCGGSGSWSPNVAAFSIALAYDLPAGHSLHVSWRPAGAGVALPAGAWRVVEQ